MYTVENKPWIIRNPRSSLAEATDMKSKLTQTNPVIFAGKHATKF